MTDLLDRVPVDRISVEARDIHLGRTLLTIVALVLWGIGWVAGKALVVVWAAVAWSAAAVKVGWADARQPAGEHRAVR